MPDYDLSRLGSRAFEQLVVSLARIEIGPGVRVFGDGPDGGREADYDGRIDWSKTVDGATGTPDTWDGYSVFQAKYRQKPDSAPMKNALWLQEQIRNDIDHWVTAARDHTRERLPEQLLFLTNVDLSSVAKSGGIDTVLRHVKGDLLGPDSKAQKHGLQIKDVKIWHGDQIRSMLDAHSSVRWAFPGLLTAGDILAALSDGAALNMGSMNLEDPIREDLVRMLRSDRIVRLGQAGATAEDRMWVDEVGIDLPAKLDDQDADVRVLRYLVAHGDANLRRKQDDRIDRPHAVVIGGPGQGKSTLSQLIAQAYRLSMLQDSDVGPDAREIIEGTRRALQRMGVSIPGNKRWPIRVDLAKYAEHLSTGSNSTLLRWISDQVSNRIESTLSPADLRTWLRTWPWVLVLDGLDEVPSLAARNLLKERLDDLLASVEDLDADLLVIITTRPTGYDETFPPEVFRHIDLSKLPARAATTFAKRMIDLRLAGEDAELRRSVSLRMAEAAKDPVTSRLMETPLQVTIMSLIVQKFPNLPPDRFSLFDLYYRTISEREQAKDIVAGRFLIDNEQHVHRLHERVGVLLQAESETAGGAEAVLTAKDLEKIAHEQYLARGFGTQDAAKRAAELVDVAMLRLVLLVPRDGGVGFEVRTLQEMMAARALAEGDDQQVLARLEVSARSPHWRNTWLLTAGKLLLDADRYESLLPKLLRQLDDPSDIVSRAAPLAGGLASAMIEDGLGTSRPKLERSLVSFVLRMIEAPAAAERAGCAQALVTLMSTEHRQSVIQHMGHAADGDASARAAAALMVDTMRRFTTRQSDNRIINTAEERLGLTPNEKMAVGAWRTVSEHREFTSQGTRVDLPTYLATKWSDTAVDAAEVDNFVTQLAEMSSSIVRVSKSSAKPIVSAFLDLDRTEKLHEVAKQGDIAATLHLALENMATIDWAAVAMFGAHIHRAASREPVGRALISMIDASRQSLDEGN